jgi:hypothetical protein
MVSDSTAFFTTKKMNRQMPVEIYVVLDNQLMER